MRVVHFLAVAEVLRAIFKQRWGTESVSPAIKWIIDLGQAALWTYCFGVVLTFGTVWVAQCFGKHWINILFIHLDNVILNVICVKVTRGLRSKSVFTKKDMLL